MCSSPIGVDGYIGTQKVFVHNGRLPGAGASELRATDKMVPGWSLSQNGFCLLTGRPMPVQQQVFEETPGQFSSRFLFRLRGCEVEHVTMDLSDSEATEAPYAAYYKHVAEAVKFALPEAEYIIINGHITFSAEVSPLKQVGMLCGAYFFGLLSQLFPTCMPATPEEKDKKHDEHKAAKVPPFGATEFLHVDVSAEEGAKQLELLFGNRQENATAPKSKYGPPTFKLPFEVLSSGTKQRRIFSVNVWRNLRADASIKSQHLALMDAQTMTEEELHAAKFKSGGRPEGYHISQLKDGHQLVYFPDMVQSEILLFKQGAYDIKQGAGQDEYRVTPAAEKHKNFIFHTSFADSTAPQGVLPRKAVACAGVVVIMAETDTQSS